MNERAIEARGSDIEEAIQRGLKRLGLGRTDVIIDVVDEGRKGLLGLGSREAVVRLTPLPQADLAEEAEQPAEQPAPEPVAEAAPAVAEEPAEEPAEAPAEAPVAKEAPESVVETVAEPAEQEAQVAAEEPAEEPEEVEAPTAEVAPALPEEEPLSQAPASEEAEAVAQEAVAQEVVTEEEEAEETERPAEVVEDEELEEVLYEILGTLMEKMGFSEAEVNVRYSEPDDKTGRVMTVAEIDDGNELNALIGAHGEVLNDLQFVARLMAGHALKRRANFLIDVNGYRRRRKEALTKLAERMAAKAVRRGEPVTLEAMNAYDRRIIHIALRDHEEVYTNSVGEGTNRRVRVYLEE